MEELNIMLTILQKCNDVDIRLICRRPNVSTFSIKQFFMYFLLLFTGRVVQSVTCLATDVCLTADPGVASSIPARCHTFMEIDHEIISMVILLPSAVQIIQEGLLSVTSESMCTKYWLIAWAFTKTRNGTERNGTERDGTE